MDIPRQKKDVQGGIPKSDLLGVTVALNKSVISHLWQKIAHTPRTSISATFSIEGAPNLWEGGTQPPPPPERFFQQDYGN